MSEPLLSMRTLERENALLRKALEDAPHEEFCQSQSRRENWTGTGTNLGLPCNCFKAALDRLKTGGIGPGGKI